MSVDKWDRAKPVMTAYEREGAGGFAAGEPWYLDMATGEWSRTPPPPDRSKSLDGGTLFGVMRIEPRRPK